MQPNSVAGGSISCSSAIARDASPAVNYTGAWKITTSQNVTTSSCNLSINVASLTPPPTPPSAPSTNPPAFPPPALPEPATWAMMIGGFALVGGMLRRRPRAVAA